MFTNFWTVSPSQRYMKQPLPARHVMWLKKKIKFTLTDAPLTFIILSLFWNHATIKPLGFDLS